MKGFMLKDLAMLKSNAKFMGIIVIVYLGLDLIGEVDISFVLPFLSVMLMISSFSYDNFNKWDAYAATLPNGRKNSVKSKYLTTILLILVISLITLIYSIIMTYIKSEAVDFEVMLGSMLGTILGTFLVLVFMYPAIYKLGLEKARMGIFISVFGVIILFSVLAKYIEVSKVLNTLSFLQNYWVLILIGLIILLTYISYKISLKFQMQKEF